MIRSLFISAVLLLSLPAVTSPHTVACPRACLATYHLPKRANALVFAVYGAYGEDNYQLTFRVNGDVVLVVAQEPLPTPCLHRADPQQKVGRTTLRTILHLASRLGFFHWPETVAHQRKAVDRRPTSITVTSSRGERTVTRYPGIDAKFDQLLSRLLTAADLSTAYS